MQARTHYPNEAHKTLTPHSLTMQKKMAATSRGDRQARLARISDRKVIDVAPPMSSDNRELISKLLGQNVNIFREEYA